MRIEKTPISGLQVISFEYFHDERGFFAETYRRDILKAEGITDEFTQDSHSRSKRGVVRGLHFQWDPPMAKMMRAATGAIFAVAVDLRVSSPTFRSWFGIELSDTNGKALYIPAGFAAGFSVLSDEADVIYKQTGHHASKTATGIRWNDSTIGINWPIAEPILSEKDRTAQSLNDWLARPESQKF